MSQKIVIDVRSPDEYNEGHREGALNIPVDCICRGEFAEISDLPQDTPIECYCASGARSERAKQVLNKCGFTNVTNAGGM